MHGDSNMIEITGCDLTKLVKAAYSLSKPQGMGFLQFKPGDLSDEETAEILARGTKTEPVSMDYVLGRACKLDVFCDENNRLWILDDWFDYSDAQLAQLLHAIDISPQQDTASCGMASR